MAKVTGKDSLSGRNELNSKHDGVPEETAFSEKKIIQEESSDGAATSYRSKGYAERLERTKKAVREVIKIKLRSRDGGKFNRNGLS